MTLSERLREAAQRRGECFDSDGLPIEAAFRDLGFSESHLFGEAADELDRLTAEIKYRDSMLQEAATALAERDARVQEPVAPPAEFCWLVELFEGDGSGNSAGWYHTGFTDIDGHSRTTKNPHEARRYSREQAEQVASKLGFTLTGTWRAVEHGFHASPPTAAPK